MIQLSGWFPTYLNNDWLDTSGNVNLHLPGSPWLTCVYLVVTVVLLYRRHTRTHTDTTYLLLLTVSGRHLCKDWLTVSNRSNDVSLETSKWLVSSSFPLTFGGVNAFNNRKHSLAVLSLRLSTVGLSRYSYHGNRSGLSLLTRQSSTVCKHLYKVNRTTDA